MHQKIVVSCLDCKKVISSNNFSQHIDSKSCREKSSSKLQHKKHPNSKPLEYKKCNFCGELFKQRNHEFYCRGDNKKKRSNQYIKAKANNSKVILTQETRNKMSLSNRGRILSKDTRNKMSIAMKEIAKNNPDYSGRYNRGKVKARICSNGMEVLGSWEELIVEKSMEENLEISKPTIGYSYIFEESTRTYYPDFYIPSLDLYIEVKGYKTEKDEAKWDHLINFHKKKLIVIQKREISLLKQNKATLKELCA